MKTYDILIVEDDLDLCEALCDVLQLQGYRVVSAENGIDALSLLNKYAVSLVISDIQMPGMDGFQLLSNLNLKYPDLPVLLMTAYGTIPKAVEAIQQGAADYLIKPFEAEILINKVKGFVTQIKAQETERVVQDAKMKQLYALTSKVAKTDVTVLLQGDSGCGKEVMARFIHEHSVNKDGPFVAVNCAAIPENMLEAMLFGYDKGAYTGAVQSMPGKFEQAQGGTLLLDEISEMDLGLQAKLLRVIQEKEVERLGSQHKIDLNVRILATTNRHLKSYVEQGKFREDLYYRLNVFPLRIPALRERPDDILPLAMELLKKHHSGSTKCPVITEQAALKLKEYRWPGNVRELDNVMQRALILQQNGLILAESLIFEADLIETTQFIESLSEAVCATDQKPFESVEVLKRDCALEESVRSAEESIILETLKDVNGSRKITAEKLGISPRTLRYKIARMKEAGIPVPC